MGCALVKNKKKPTTEQDRWEVLLQEADIEYYTPESEKPPDNLGDSLVNKLVKELNL